MLHFYVKLIHIKACHVTYRFLQWFEFFRVVDDNMSKQGRV